MLLVTLEMQAATVAPAAGPYGWVGPALTGVGAVLIAFGTVFKPSSGDKPSSEMEKRVASLEARLAVQQENLAVLNDASERHERTQEKMAEKISSKLENMRDFLVALAEHLHIPPPK